MSKPIYLYILIIIMLLMGSCYISYKFGQVYNGRTAQEWANQTSTNYIRAQNDETKIADLNTQLKALQTKYNTIFNAGSVLYGAYQCIKNIKAIYMPNLGDYYAGNGAIDIDPNNSYYSQFYVDNCLK